LKTIGVMEGTLSDRSMANVDSYFFSFITDVNIHVKQLIFKINQRTGLTIDLSKTADLSIFNHQGNLVFTYEFNRSNTSSINDTVILDVDFNLVKDELYLCQLLSSCGNNLFNFKVVGSLYDFYNAVFSNIFPEQSIMRACGDVNNYYEYSFPFIQFIGDVEEPSIKSKNNLCWLLILGLITGLIIYDRSVNK